MATIEISPAFVSGYVSRMMQLGTWLNSPASSVLSRASTNGLMASPGTANYPNTGNLNFYIMKGTVPTDFATLANFNARASDVLITYTGVSNATGNFSPSVTNTNPVVITSNYLTASASGTATWFWWTVRPTTGGSVSGTDALMHQIIGTIGMTGTGADLEIPDTNIVSGAAYRITNIRLQFPTSWTF